MTLSRKAFDRPASRVSEERGVGESECEKRRVTIGR